MGREIGECEVVIWSKSNDIALASHSLCSKEQRRKTWGDKLAADIGYFSWFQRTAVIDWRIILRLFFLYSAIIVDEHKGFIIMRVRIASSPFVTGAKVAGRVMSG